MKKCNLLGFLLACSFYTSFSQTQSIVFTSSDTALQTAFYRAKEMALHYKGKPGDPVGAWYESALPPRSAFCMRDVSHQCIAAEALGLDSANKNMLTLFAKNISKSKDWCSYWEMNKYGNAAPEDYRNDTAFWYNLNANFDLLNACWRMYLWTGDKTYINSPVFKNFYEKSVGEFIKRWALQPDELLTRPGYPNNALGFNHEDAFYRCRGLASYSEGVPNIKMGVDLVAALYRGMLSYAAMLDANGKTTEALQYKQKAAAYQANIDKYWWDGKAGRYYTYYSNDNKFGRDEGETFLLWFDALQDSVRKQKTIEYLLAGKWNVENLSYFPYILYKNGYMDEAYGMMLHLTDPETKRREYPEVSFGVILGFIQGLMGIEPDARVNRVGTLYETTNIAASSIDNIDVIGTTITLQHTLQQSALTNKGNKAITWRVKFSGIHKQIEINRKPIKTRYEKNGWGKMISFADIVVKPEETVVAKIN